jgi:hypothetical protein
VLELLQKIASDGNKSKRWAFSMSPKLTGHAKIWLAGDELAQDIRSWLSPPDPWKNQNEINELRHPGTAAWFLNGKTFTEWKSSEQSSLLWIHGIRRLRPTHAPPLRLMVFSLSQRAQERASSGM